MASTTEPTCKWTALPRELVAQIAKDDPRRKLLETIPKISISVERNGCGGVQVSLDDSITYSRPDNVIFKLMLAFRDPVKDHVHIVRKRALSLYVQYANRRKLLLRAEFFRRTGKHVFC